MGGVGPVSSPAPSPSPTVFQRLGYRFAVPEGWYASEGSRPWEGVGDPPLRSAAPFDSFVSPEVFPWIVIGKRPLTTEVSLDQWIEQLIADRAITYQPEQCTTTTPHIGTGSAATTPRPTTVQTPGCDPGPGGQAV